MLPSRHSGGRFGFKAQKEVWLDTGNLIEDGRDEKSPTNTYNRLPLIERKTNEDPLAKFYNRVGWTEGKPENSRSIDYFTYSTLFLASKPENAPKGYLPGYSTILELAQTTIADYVAAVYPGYFSRIEKCIPLDNTKDTTKSQDYSPNNLQ